MTRVHVDEERTIRCKNASKNMMDGGWYRDREACWY